MPESSQLLISTLPPSRAQRRAALSVAAALLLFSIAVLPFADARLPRTDLVVPVVSTVMALGDGISAVLLFGQFAVLRTRSLLVLAGGYLFTGLLVIVYALTFPGAFSESGLLSANLQTAAWLFVFWHLGLPLAVMGYALLGDAHPALRVVSMDVPAAIATASAIAIALAALVTWSAIAYASVLPTVAEDAVRMTRQTWVRVPMVLLSVAAVIVLARRRRSVLDLWLLVVCFAWLLDSLFTFVTESRYTGAWYANRVVRIVAANAVLFVLLAESMRLYARLASSVMAQRRERERRTMTMEAMAAAIEHEVRQPLGAIVANAAAAQRWMEHSPPNVGEAREAVGTIAGDAERAADIVRSVRSLYAAAHQAHESLDANAIIEEAIELARSDLDASAVGVQLQLAQVPRLAGNRRQLQEVILNLVHNAADAMREVTGNAAVLSISSAAIDGNRVEIIVADTGAGIDPKNLERIFEPFFTQKAGGVGMGLAICRSVVERHGGTISASCGNPYGSVFRVVLPCN